MARRSRAAPRIDPDIARLGVVLGDRSRIAMLDALLDGQPRSIGSLASYAGISAATASEHVHKLVDERLVATTRSGRERYVQLASEDVARLLEAMARLAQPSPTFTAHAGRRAGELRFARTCYDHVAGIVGVRIANALIARGWLVRDDDKFTAQPALVEWIGSHGVAIGASRRPLVRSCVDWSERQPHVAGRIGTAIATMCLRNQWLVRVRESRALRLTDRGRRALARELDVEL